MNQQKHIIVVGAGWAGLSAAIHLSLAHYKVTVLEAAPKMGGRARGVKFNKETVDNGQHLIIGAYTEFLALLKILKINEQDILERKHFRLPIYSMNSSAIQWDIIEKLCSNYLKGPLKFLNYFPIRDWFSCFKLYKMLDNLPLKSDISVLQFLKQINQSDKAIENFWEPLTLAALTTPIAQASANVFLRVIKNTFLNTSHSDLLFPKKNLSELFPNPAADFLKQRGQTIILNERINGIAIEKADKIIVKSQNQSYLADAVILATTPQESAKLFSTLNGQYYQVAPLIHSLNQFTYLPITTVYLEYEDSIKMQYPILGMVGGVGHWVFDRHICTKSNILSVVISGHQNPYFNESFSKTKLVELICAEIKIFFPNLSDPINYKIITEKKACFSCNVNVDKIRPTNVTPVKNVYLAGDYTNTGYPATLESAVLSGKSAAIRIIENDI